MTISGSDSSTLSEHETMDDSQLLESAGLESLDGFPIPTLAAGSAIPTVSFNDLLACPYIQPTVKGPEDENTADIYMTFSVLKLIDINDLQETLKFFGSVNFMWKVTTCSSTLFNASNIERLIALSPEKVWKPKFMMKNTTVDRFMTSKRYTHDMQILYVPTYPNVTFYFYWTVLGTMETKCKINVKYFPFDTQTCDVFMVLKEPNGFVRFNGTFSSSGSSKSPNSIWQIAGEETGHGQLLGHIFNVSYAYFRVKLTRNPYYYTYALMAPALILLLTCLVTFALPPQSSERASAACSFALGFSFTQAAIIEQVPQTSERILFAEFMFYITVVSAASACFHMFATTISSVRFYSGSISLVRFMDMFAILALLFASVGLTVDIMTEIQNN